MYLIKHDIQYYLILLLFVVFGHSCVESPDMPSGIFNGKSPEVMTSEAQEITFYEATLTGEVVSNNGKPTSERGFYFGSSPDPITSGTQIKCGAGTGKFSNTRINLKNGTKYYYTAYAINEDGKSIGNTIEFQTLGKVWEQLEDFRGLPRINECSFVIGHELYITCGEAQYQDSFEDTWKYDVETNKWIPCYPFPESKRRNPCAFVIDNKAYAGMGQYRGQTYFNDFYLFEGDSWNSNSVGSTSITPRRKSMAFSMSGEGYIVGGRNNDIGFRDVWKFNPSSKEWKRLKDFPIILYDAIVVSGNNRAFIGFGTPISTSSETTQYNIWEYNEVTDSWIVFTTAPTEIGTVYAGVMLKDKIYVVNNKNMIWEMDLETKEWVEKSIMPAVFGKQASYQKMFATDEYIYIGMNNFTLFFYKYNPSGVEEEK